MAQYIKKVAVTPVRGNGFIIDSLNTNDNEHFNAPSLALVKNNIDNNLLFNGAFLNFRGGGFKVNGWTIAKNALYVGAEAVFSASSGLIVPPGYKGTLTSPAFSCFDNSTLDLTKPYSLTVLFGVVGSSGEIVGKAENITNSAVMPIVLKIFDGKLKVTMNYIALGGALQLLIENIGSNALSIHGVKFEVGSSCTPFILNGKQYGVQNLVSDAIAAKIKSDVTDKFSVLTGTLTTNASGEASVNLSYPSGFDVTNCVVISVAVSDKYGEYHFHKNGSDGTSTREYCVLRNGGISLYYQGTSTDASTTITYRVALYRFA